MENNDTARSTRNTGAVINHTGPVSGKLFSHALALRELVECMPAIKREEADQHIRAMFREIDRVDGLERADLAQGARVHRRHKGGA